MLRPSAAVGTRIAIGEGPQIAEAYLFVHVQLNSYRLLKENKPNDFESTARTRVGARAICSEFKSQKDRTFGNVLTVRVTAALDSTYGINLRTLLSRGGNHSHFALGFAPDHRRPPRSHHQTS